MGVFELATAREKELDQTNNRWQSDNVAKGLLWSQLLVGQNVAKTVGHTKWVKFQRMGALHLFSWT